MPLSLTGAAPVAHGDTMKKLIMAVAVAASLSGTCWSQQSDMVELKISNVTTGETADTATSGTIRQGFVKRLYIDVGDTGIDADFTVKLYDSKLGTYETVFSQENVTTNVDVYPLIVADTIDGGTTTNQFITLPIYKQAVVFSGVNATATNKTASMYLIWTSQP